MKEQPWRPAVKAIIRISCCSCRFPHKMWLNVTQTTTERTPNKTQASCIAAQDHQKSSDDSQRQKTKNNAEKKG